MHIYFEIQSISASVKKNCAFIQNDIVVVIDKGKIT